MNSVYRKFSILLAIFLLGGCSTMQASQPQNTIILPAKPTQVVVPSQLDMLMKYYELLQEKTKPELAQEFATVKKNFMHNNSDKNRIRYILLLSLPNADFRNISDALSLLMEWPQDSQQSQQLTSMTSFRKLLTQLLTEQQHLNSTVKNFSEKLKAVEAYSEKLQKRVEDIKDMEKSLIRRESQPNIN